MSGYTPVREVLELEEKRKHGDKENLLPGAAATEDEENDGVRIPDNLDSEGLAHNAFHIVALSFFWAGYSTFWFILDVEIVPDQVEAIAGSDDKGKALGGVIAAGSIVTLLVSPVIGMVTDRFDRFRIGRRWGKRRPLMVVGALLSAAVSMGLAAMQPHHEHDPSRYGPYTNDTAFPGEKVAPNSTRHPQPTGGGGGGGEDTFHVGAYVGYMAVFMTLCFCVVLHSVPYNGLVADFSPRSKRGTVSGIFGCASFTGMMAASGLGYAYDSLSVVLTMLIANAILLLCLLVTCASTGEGGAASREPQTHRPWPTSFLGMCREFLEPFKNRDFFFVFFTRFLMQMGFSSIIRFMQYWFEDKVHLPAEWSAEKALAICMLPLLGVAFFSALGFGWLSDHLGRRRKVIVATNGVVAAAAAVALAFINDYWAILPINLLLGAALGGFVSVDFALVMDVLPSNRDNAKDLALWHSAIVIPQMTAVPLGGVIRDAFQHVGCGEECGMGYTALFLMAAIFFLTGSVLVSQIKHAN